MDFEVIWRRSCVDYTRRFQGLWPFRTMEREAVIDMVSNLFAWYKMYLSTEHTALLNKVLVPGKESHLLDRLWCPYFQNWSWNRLISITWNFWKHNEYVMSHTALKGWCNRKRKSLFLTDSDVQFTKSGSVIFLAHQNSEKSIMGLLHCVLFNKGSDTKRNSLFWGILMCRFKR